MSRPRPPWLRRPLLWTTDAVRARRSRFYWTERAGGHYGLSLLGIINGLLPAGWWLVQTEDLPDVADRKPGTVGGHLR